MEKIRKAKPKFTTRFLGNALTRGPQVRGLGHWCGLFHKKGLTPSYGGGSYGNLSVRLKQAGDEFLITASGIKLKNKLLPKDFFHVVKVNFTEKTVYGFGINGPSSETLLHDAIYKKRKDAGAVFHGHCGEILKCARVLGVCTTENEEPYGSTKLVTAVLRTLGRRRFLVMKNHGFISLGRTMKEAGDLALKILRDCSRNSK